MFSVATFNFTEQSRCCRTLALWNPVVHAQVSLVPGPVTQLIRLRYTALKCRLLHRLSASVL